MKQIRLDRKITLYHEFNDGDISDKNTVVYFGILVDISPTSTQSQFSQLVVDRIVQNKKPAPYYYPMQLVYSYREEKQKPTGLENTLKLS